MTYRELYLSAKRALGLAGIEDPGHEVMLLFSRFFGMDRSALALRGESAPPAGEEKAFLRAVEERKGRRPLQYILGSWDFMGLSLQVGEGVLSPREDTAVLVEALAERLQNRPAPVGLDLCAGAGAVALGLCSLLPRARVTCLELSGQALPYLRQNLAAHPQFAVAAEQGDVLLPETAARFAPESLDFIASNPPYVRSGEIPLLQPELQKEPLLALDGGEDGSRFYRAIVSLWLPLVKPGGFLAVEIGEDLGETVRRLFAAAGLRDVAVKRDLAGWERCVIGTK